MLNFASFDIIKNFYFLIQNNNGQSSKKIENCPLNAQYCFLLDYKSRFYPHIIHILFTIAIDIPRSLAFSNAFFF